MARTMRVVNFFGGPGTGKSTLAAGLFYRFKLLDLNVELVTEYAKDLVYSEHLPYMMDKQEFIYAEQNYRIQRLNGKVDWVITDSPIILSAVYPVINRELFEIPHWPALREFQSLVHKQFSCYDNYNIWLERNTEYKAEGRLQDKAQAERCDNLIWSELLNTNPTRIKQFLVTENVLEEIITYLLDT